MRGLSKLLLFLLCSLGSQLNGQNLVNDAFFIAPKNENITFFRINLKPTNPEVSTTLLLRERQVFMSNDPNSQAVALLEDISFQTTSQTIYRNIGTGVCINPQTPVKDSLSRYNPGESVVLFVAPKDYNNQDWERAKAYFRKNKEKLPKENYYEITILWEIPPSDTTNSLIIPIIVNAASKRIARILINEEMARFKHEHEKSVIRKEVIKHYGKTREKSLHDVCWIAGPTKLEARYDYRVAFRVW